MAAQKDNETEWKRIQTKTFTRWCNEHLKVQHIEIEDLSTAFCDGVKLIILLEVLSGKSIGKYNKVPKRPVQKMENVSKALEFIMKAEKIKLVNIGTGDIVTPNLKLILGLVWTLILHYQISHGFQIDGSNSPRHGGHSGHSAKQALLDYIRDKLPNKTIKNLTTDWNDGILIASLVDAHAPGLCTEAEAMDPENALENASLAMTLAQDWLGIAQDMVNPKVDELSMMTYLSQFLDAKLKPGAPLKPRVDPTNVVVYGPGVEENGFEGVPEKAVFTVDITGAGSGAVSAHCTGPNGPVTVDIEDNHDQTYTCTYIPQGPGVHTINVQFNSKPVKDSPFKVNISAGFDASKVKVTGPGLLGGCVREPLNLIIDSGGAGQGSMNIVIDGPEATTTTDTLDDGTNSLVIVASEVGECSVQVEYGGQPVPGSPFLIPVCDPSRVRVLGAGAKGEGVILGELAEVLVDMTDSGVGLLEVGVTLPNGKLETLKMTPADQPNVLKGSYRPSAPGVYKVNVQLAKAHVLSSRVHVAQRVHISGSKVAYVDVDNIIDVHAADGDMGAEFQFKGRPGLKGVDCNFERKSADHKIVHYTPHHVGTLLVTVQCSYTALQHEVRCLDPSKVAVSEGICSAIAEMQQTFVVDTSLAGPGKVDIQITDPTGRPLHAYVVDSEDASGVYSVTYTPPAITTPLSAPPICKVEISFEGKAIQNSPFEVQVSSPGNVKGYGTGLEKAIAMEPISFTVDASQAGDGALNLTIEGPEECNIDCKANGDHIYCVSYVPPLAGTYSVNIKFADVHIPGSPFLVACSRAPPDASKCHAVMEADNQAIMVDAKNAGGTGALEVGVWGAQVPARYVTVEHNGDYTFNVSYEIPEPGETEISIKWHGQHIKGSPFKVVTE
eukprot:Em0006g1345a